MKRFVMRPLVTVICVAGALGTSHALASAFQIWEQDGASIGNYHAGYAAAAQDASTAWYNPAGITRFRNQQIVFGADAIMSSFKYKGSVSVTENTPKIITEPPFLVVTPSTYTFPGVTAQGGQFSVVPSLHYVTPINDWMGFGFSIDVPFGLKTNYGSSTPLRYAATLSAITVIDISPSLAVKFLDKPSVGKASFGAGFDIQRAFAEFDASAVLLDPISLLPPYPVAPDIPAASENKANDTAYGYHLGLLYELSPDTRAGISYHSQVVHHFTGFSNFSGEIPRDLVGGPVRSGNAIANVTLPPYTALSLYHKVNPNIAVMGTIIYTQWSTFNRLVLQNVAGAVQTTDPLDPVVTTKNIIITVPEHYRNSWNFVVGMDWYATDKITLRAGVGYDQTPVRNAYRNVQLPDNNRYVIALGGHYQMTKPVGFDLGWTHFFVGQSKVNPPPQVTGAETVGTNGTVTGGADVIGGQVVWDIV